MKDMLQIEFFKRLLWMWTEEGCKLNFFWNIFLHLHSLCGITYFEPNCRFRWIFMDFLTENFVIFHCFKYFCSKLFKKYIRLKQAFEILKSVKIYHFLFGNPWISMPSWVLVSIFKCKIDHIGAKNKFQINFGFATPVMWLALWGPCLPKICRGGPDMYRTKT